MNHNRNRIVELLKLVGKIAPEYYLLIFINALVGGGGICVNLWASRILIDQIADSHRIFSGIELVLFITASSALTKLIDNAVNYAVNIKTPLIRERMKEAMSDKSMRTSYYRLEDSEYNDLKERAMFAINEQGALYNIVFNIADICRHIAILMSIIGIVLGFSKLFVIILLLSVGLMFSLYSRYLRYQKKFYDNLALVNRREEFYKNIIFDKKYGLDYRVHKIKNLLEERYCSFLEKCCKLMDDFYTIKGKYLASFEIADNIIKIISYGYVGLRRFSDVFGEKISIGACMMYINAVSNFSSHISRISENSVQIKQMFKYLEPYFEFMGAPDDVFDDKEMFDEKIKEIRFDKVYFKYPGSEKYALENLSFTIREGDIVAIVGTNGSGKTTIIKLICKFYLPTSGKIFINGRDIATLNTKKYREKISTVFQDYRLINMSIKNNILSNQLYNKKFDKIVEITGISQFNNKLPKGVDTIIGREIDKEGIELSGGESQKIALARAAYKDASLYMLDEPTSALDPISEVEIYEDMQKIVKHNTAIFVSHRLFSCKMCDYILVLNRGKLVESGKHDILIRKKGIYRELYNTQMQSFNYDFMEKRA